jgi:hypothetical protein
MHQCADIYLLQRQTLHVSGNYVPIIKRNYRTNGTPDICHSIWMTVWYEDSNETVSFCPSYQTVIHIE